MGRKASMNGNVVIGVFSIDASVCSESCLVVDVYRTPQGRDFKDFVADVRIRCLSSGVLVEVYDWDGARLGGAQVDVPPPQEEEGVAGEGTEEEPPESVGIRDEEDEEYLPTDDEVAYAESCVLGLTVEFGSEEE